MSAEESEAGRAGAKRSKLDGSGAGMPELGSARFVSANVLTVPASKAASSSSAISATLSRP